MGSYDCYCAICGASLVGARVGSTSPKAQKWRRKAVHRRAERRRRRAAFPDLESEGSELEAQEVHYDAESDAESDADKEEAENEEDYDDDDDDDDADADWEDVESDSSFDPWEENTTYDPNLVSEEDLEWLIYIRCIGFNPDAGKAYISGPARYENHGVAKCQQGTDPYEPRLLPHQVEATYNCYDPYDDDRGPVYPFHWCCLELLCRAITGSTDITGLDNDILYDSMCKLNGNGGPMETSSLNVDYGEISGQDEMWECIPGEEFSVVHPTVLPGFERRLGKALSKHNFQISPANVDLGKHHVSDCFSTLPYTLLHEIFQHLSGESILSLIRASMSVHLATRHQQFWKWLIRREMPWLWEILPLLQVQRPPEFSYKGLYLWLEKVTRPQFGMCGHYMGVANRRRIWKVCEEIATVYSDRLNIAPTLEADLEAQDVLAQSSPAFR